MCRLPRALEVLLRLEGGGLEDEHHLHPPSPPSTDSPSGELSQEQQKRDHIFWAANERVLKKKRNTKRSLPVGVSAPNRQGHYQSLKKSSCLSGEPTGG